MMGKEGNDKDISIEDRKGGSGEGGMGGEEVWGCFDYKRERSM